MKRDLIFVRVYPHSQAQVWQALTDSRVMAEWLMENNFEPRVGHKFQFRTKPRPGFNGIVNCQVLEVNEPTRLSYTWQGGAMRHPTVVTWTLDEVDTGTRVRLEHTGFEGLGGMWVSLILGAGWRRLLTRKFRDALDRLASETGPATSGR